MNTKQSSNTNTKQRILTEAVKLFARDGFDAVTTEMIAAAVGIKAPSLYKHFQSKRDIFDSILREMEHRDAENAAVFEMPLDPPKKSGADYYEQASIKGFLDYCRMMFKYWTEDEFASSFRKMLTVEQYKSREMNELYHQYLGAGPLEYTTDILGSEQAALALYGPMFMLYSIYDNASEKQEPGPEDTASVMLDEHLKSWYATYGEQMESR